MRRPEGAKTAPSAFRAGRGARSAHADARRRARGPRHHGPTGRARDSLSAPRIAAFVLALLGAACGSASEQAGRVHARVIRPPKDTIRFEAPARARRCSAGPGSVGMLLQGSTGGNGVILWLRAGRGGGDSLAAGPWPLLQRGDTVSPRGATVAVRYMLNEVAHGLPLDSGAVEVRQTGGC